MRRKVMICRKAEKRRGGEANIHIGGDAERWRDGKTPILRGGELERRRDRETEPHIFKQREADRYTESRRHRYACVYIY